MIRILRRWSYLAIPARDGYDGPVPLPQRDPGVYLQVLAREAGAAGPVRPVRHDAVVRTRHRALYPVSWSRRTVAQRLVRNLRAVPSQAGDSLQPGPCAAGLGRHHGEWEFTLAPWGGVPVVARRYGTAAGLLHGGAAHLIPLYVLHLTPTDLVA